jgi:hypothetical protein
MARAVRGAAGERGLMVAVVPQWPLRGRTGEGKDRLWFSRVAGGASGRFGSVVPTGLGLGACPVPTLKRGATIVPSLRDAADWPDAPPECGCNPLPNAD